MMIEVLAAAADTSNNSGMSTIWVALITGAATLAGSWLLFRGQNKQSAAEGIVEERKLLASEWGKIREAVDHALEECRIERDELTRELDELCRERDKLKLQLSDVTIELRQIKSEVAELRKLHEGE